jgi:alkylhydroperoxidase family enzyme
MLHWLIGKRLDAAEAELGASVEYLRHIQRVSLPAFFRFTKIFPLARYRRALPAAPCHVARLVATRHEDCGPCVQIAVNLAKKDRMDAHILQAVLDDRPTDLPEDLADVYHFTEAVVKLTGEEGPFRERIHQRYGEAALIELAFAIAVSRIFPTTKRALGYAASCSQVAVNV